MVWNGAEIRRRRSEHGLTQQQLADAVGASRRAVASWESDESTPQGRFYNALQQLLGVDEPEPERAADRDPQGDLRLRDADFTQTLNHLIDLHNEALRGGLHRVLRVEDVPLPADLPEHDVTQGPRLVDGTADSPSEQTSDSTEKTRTGPDDRT